MSEESDVMPHVSRRVKELRARKGLSAKQLGERMTERCGVTWDRFTVANLETGRRKNLTVDELLALARVLDVAPVHLLVPIVDQPFRVLPTEVQPADRVRAWIRGETPLPGTDHRVYRTEVPDEEWRDVDLPEAAQVENEVSRHLIPGLEAALSTDLTPDDIADYVRRTFTVMRTLQEARGGDDG